MKKGAKFIYNKNEIYEKAIKVIKDNNLFFINDVVAYLPCSPSTFYEFFPAKSEESEYLKELLNTNRTKKSINIRQKLYDSDNVSGLIALYKLVGTPEERQLLLMTNNESNDSKTEKPTYNFINFLKAFNRNYLVYNHTDYIREKLLNNLKDGVNTYITMPPQHGKSTTVLAVIGEMLVTTPNLKVAYASYSQSFSEGRCKELKYALEEFGFRGETWNNNLMILNNNARLTITSIGGKLTGEPQDIIVIDDAIKDAQEAFSKVIKERVWKWFEMVAETRVSEQNKGTIVVIGTRWHSDDIIGKIKSNRNYDGIDLKAIADDNDSLGRTPGTALFPERYNEQSLNKIKEDKPQIFELLYQGNDKALNDAIFQEINYTDSIPEKLQYAIGADLSYTNNKESDFTAIVVVGIDIENNTYYVIETNRWKGEINETIVRLKLLQDKYQCVINMEYNGVQIGIVDLLEREGLKINKIKINASKLVRALPTSQLWNSGKVLLNKNVSEEFISEVCNFTGTAADKNDDYVDALVYSTNLRIL